MKEVMFSIITVTYNSEKTIRDTMESVLRQTYKNYEYIIVDGNSKDHTMDIVKEYESKFEGRLRYISEPDSGIYDAMNKGIKLSKGDFIGIINSDDWYEDNALENVVEAGVDEKYVVYYGYMRTVDSSNGKEIRCAIYNHEYIKDAMINHPTVFVSREIYEKYGVFDCQYKMSADYDFIVRLVEHKNIKFVAVNKVQANFRTGGASEGIDALCETMKIKKRYGYMTSFQYMAAIVYLKARKVFGYYTNN